MREQTRTNVTLSERERVVAVEIRCDDCGYGAVVAQLPARCPMCSCTTWRQKARDGGEGR